MKPDGIYLAGVNKIYKGRSKTVEALKDVSLSCPTSSFTALIGPSGCGKSTLMRIALGLETPDSGKVLLEGVTPAEATKIGKIGIAFQDAALLPWRSVRRNIEVPLNVLRKPIKDYTAKIQEMINLANKEKLELITTEKDYFRINENYKKNINFLKIEIEMENRNQFIDQVKKII
jgi:NitT/TauT family transport system ATP-binding protein